MLRTARLVKGWKMSDVGRLLGTVRGASVINSRSGRIHLFPAVEPNAAIAFRDRQARGGFEVSAECIRGKVTYVRIRARRNVPCQVMNPWPGKRVRVREMSSQKVVPHELDTSRGECVVFPAQTGVKYLIEHE